MDWLYIFVGPLWLESVANICREQRNCWGGEVLNDVYFDMRKACWEVLDQLACGKLAKLLPTWARLMKDGKAFVESLRMSVYEKLISMCKD